MSHKIIALIEAEENGGADEVYRRLHETHRPNSAYYAEFLDFGNLVIRQRFRMEMSGNSASRPQTAIRQQFRKEMKGKSSASRPQTAKKERKIFEDQKPPKRKGPVEAEGPPTLLGFGGAVEIHEEPSGIATTSAISLRTSAISTMAAKFFKKIPVSEEILNQEQELAMLQLSGPESENSSRGEAAQKTLEFPTIPNIPDTPRK